MPLLSVIERHEIATGRRPEPSSALTEILPSMPFVPPLEYREASSPVFEDFPRAVEGIQAAAAEASSAAVPLPLYAAWRDGEGGTCGMRGCNRLLTPNALSSRCCTACSASNGAFHTVGCELYSDAMMCAEVRSGHLPFTDAAARNLACLLYTSPSPRDKRQSRMPSSA